MNLKRLPVEFDAKAVADDGTFEGYASVFGNVDSYKDVVAPGAFKASLAMRPPSRVKLLWQHDPSQPIGVWQDMAEDSKGLHARGQLALGTPKGQEAYQLMKMGAIDGLSIGFYTKEDEFDRQSGIRTLKAVDLMEVSIVTFQACPGATVTAVKAEDMTEREFERLLTQDAGFTRSQARIVINHGFKALKSMRDAAEGESTADLLAAIRRAETALLS